MTHTTKALRLHLINGLTSAGWPWAILALTFVINLAIFGLLDGIPVEDRQTGAVASLYIVTLVANLQIWTQGLPFALGLSVTRRAFFGGTTLFVLIQSVVVGVVLTALNRLEGAVGGWGIDLKFFRAWLLDQPNLLVQFLVYTVPFACLSALGMVLGVVFRRWGPSGMYLLTIGSLLVGGAAGVIVTWREAWGDVGRFFTESSVLALAAGWPALLTLAFGGAAYLALRRATA